MTAFTVATELTVLRHMLRLGRRWGYLDHVPDVELPKKPEGRRRFLDEAEIGKLLEPARSPAIPTSEPSSLSRSTRGCEGEILGLEWERVDLGSARLTLYKTKSGKPRGVPMNRAVYDTLITLGPRSLRLQDDPAVFPPEPGALAGGRSTHRWAHVCRRYDT